MVTLSGDDFIHKLHPADIMDVPEFFKRLHGPERGRPIRQFSQSRNTKPPTRRKIPRNMQKLIGRIQGRNPPSTSSRIRKPSTGIDLSLADIDPGAEMERDCRQDARPKFIARL